MADDLSDAQPNGVGCPPDSPSGFVVPQQLVPVHGNLTSK